MARRTLFLVLVLIVFMTSPMAEALLGQLLSETRIQGILYCTANGNGNYNGTSSSIFPNALVQLQCGTGNTVARATTNASGLFTVVMNPLNYLLSTLLSSCNLVVKTPLSNCDVSLPSVGGLVSSLQFVGNIVQGLLSITSLIPSGFQFLANVN